MILISAARSPQAIRPRYRLLTLGRLALLCPDGTAEPSLAPGGRKLAVLTYLALAGRPLTRDHLAEVFWGDRNDARARHSLREALSHLRRVLGVDSIPSGGESVSLLPGATLDVDLLEFGAAANAGDHAAVLTLAHGVFLDGVHVPGSIRFEEWLRRERAAADRWVARACAAECERTGGALDSAQPPEAAARWLEVSPMEAAAQLALLRAHAAPGTPEAIGRALAEYRRLSVRLAREYGAAPAPEVERAAATLAERLAGVRSQVAPRPYEPHAFEASATASPDSPALAAPAAAAAEHVPLATRPPHDPAIQRIAPWRTAVRAALVLAAVAAAAGTGVIGWRLMASPRPPTPSAGVALVAITAVRNLGRDTADAWLEAGVPEMLGMGLARAGVDVVPPGRVREASGRAAADGRLSGQAAVVLASALGATWQVDGGIAHGPQGFVLDLEVRSAPQGVSRASITVTGPDLIATVDRATARLVAALDAPAAGSRLEDVETGSVAAYRAFTAGIQLRYEGRTEEATRAFDAAIAADSGFASAVVERLLVLDERSPAFGRVRSLYARVHGHAPEFDRRMLEVLDAFYGGDAERAEQLARALVARYPRDPRAYDNLHMVLSAHGRLMEADDALVRRLALDSLATASTRAGPCALCTSHALLAADYAADGRSGEAERAARRAVELQPENPATWAVLSHVQAQRGWYDEAIRAQTRAIELAPREIAYAGELVRRQIEAGQFGSADETIRRWRRAGAAEYGDLPADLEATILREEGRYAEAAAVLAGYLARDTADAALALVLGHTLAAAGRPEAAARVFATRAHMKLTAGDGFRATAARAFAWPHALLADALYLAGTTDTVRLSALADSIQEVGAHSYFARDWTLHHHVRGLIDMIAHRWPAAEQEFTAARFGLIGWTRTLAELAKAQLAQGKADAALATIRVAYQAPLDGMGRYLPRSELDLLMAQTFAAAGQPDSAGVYVARLRAAWEHADARVKQRLRRLTAPRTLRVGTPAASSSARGG